MNHPLSLIFLSELCHWTCSINRWFKKEQRVANRIEGGKIKAFNWTIVKLGHKLTVSHNLRSYVTVIVNSHNGSNNRIEELLDIGTLIYNPERAASSENPINFTRRPKILYMCTNSSTISTRMKLFREFANSISTRSLKIKINLNSHPRYRC